MELVSRSRNFYLKWKIAVDAGETPVQSRMPGDRFLLKERLVAVRRTAAKGRSAGCVAYSWRKSSDGSSILPSEQLKEMRANHPHDQICLVLRFYADDVSENCPHGGYRVAGPKARRGIRLLGRERSRHRWCVIVFLFRRAIDDAGGTPANSTALVCAYSGRV